VSDLTLPHQNAPAGPDVPDTHELRFEGPNHGHIVPAAILADALQAAQRVVHFLAMARSRMPLRRRARVPRDIELAFPVLCDVSRQGSYLQPIRIGDPSVSLLSPAETENVRADFDRVLDAAVRGDAKELADTVVDAKWRNAVLDAISRMPPRPATGFTLAVASLRGAKTFELSAALQKIEALALPSPAPESRTVIGSLQAIDFGEQRLTLRDPRTSRTFNCFYVDEIEPMLLENARQLIQVTGEVEVDAQGAPVKVVATTDIRPVDLDPIPLFPFEVMNRRVEPIVPRSLTPELDDSAQMFVLQDEAIGIDLAAETRAELEEMLAHELRLLWRDYALAPDELLTTNARSLKRRLLAAFRLASDAT